MSKGRCSGTRSVKSIREKRERGDSGGEEVAAAEREAATMVRALMDTRMESGADE